MPISAGAMAVGPKSAAGSESTRLDVITKGLLGRAYIGGTATLHANALLRLQRQTIDTLGNAPNRL
ncbi:hypothetical protein ACIBO4_31090 [Streptomyces sp. NPDC050149]|uniref:hypothetical protein n=1 Tax=Streptomyces sp. NPDC050149 TaxID=3365603 RepID=UPI0037BA5375